MPRGHTAKTYSGRQTAQSGAVIIGRRMVYSQHPLLPLRERRRPVAYPEVLAGGTIVPFSLAVMLVW